jgi:hypothetical protein
MGRFFGRLAGLQLAVEVSDHSINVKMESVDKSERAWDTDLFKSGNLFVSNYANPIKPRVSHNPNLETPNEVEAVDGNPDGDTEPDNDRHAQLISSGRYREFMRQDLISQLLTPESRWNILVWAVISVAVLQFLGIIITLWATGSFS